MSMLEFGDEYQAWERQSLRKAQIQRGISLLEQGIKPTVSEFDDHALWCQELDDYRISEKFTKLPEVAQGFLLEVMNEHFDYIQEMTNPMTTQDPDTNPEMTPTTAAQENEQQVMADAPPEAEGPPDLPEMPPEVDPNNGGI